MIFETKEIRNVVIAGHKGTGKTTLFEQIMFNGDAIQNAQKVDSGKTVSDWTEEEIEKKESIYSSLGNVVWKNQKMNFIDTPGTNSYIGELICGLRSCESALVVLDAKNGVQIETLKIWRQLNERKKARAIFINKMDIAGADYFKIIEDLKTRFKKTFVPVTIPIGSGENYRGMINLIIQKAYLIHNEGEKDLETDIPEDMKETVAKMREQMIELAAEGDDKLIEKYFNEGTLTEQEIRQGISLGMQKTKVVPVMCGSSIQNNGIASFLNFLSVVAPSPSDIVEKAVDKDNQDIDVKLDNTTNLSAMTFKTKLDKFSGKMSYIKILTGILTSDMELHNTTTLKKFKVGKIWTSIGKKLIEVEKLSAGDLGIIVKIDDLQTNDTIGTLDIQYHIKNLRLPHPAYSLAISCKDKKDEDKLNDFFSKVAQQDLTFQIGFNKETKENVVSGVDEQHLKMIINNCADKNKIEYTLKTPKIPYRETITKSTTSEYTHKKQSGGHGQYGKVIIKFDPLERGAFFEFKNEVKGGAISKNYMLGIEKGLLETMEIGFLAGYPIVDLSATVLDGKEHPVDSSEMAFKLAARGALRDALKNASMVLLEPIMLIKIYSEEKYIGDILSDLSSKRAKILKQDSLGDITELDAEVPQSEITQYAVDLKALTSATGTFDIDFSHYTPISGKTAEKVIADAKFQLENEDNS